MTETDERVFEGLDYLADDSVTIADPYPFFEYLRKRGPVAYEPHHGVVIVTGHAEALEVYSNHEVYSVANDSLGPFYGLEVQPGTDDITELVEDYRKKQPLQTMMFMDPPEHGRYRDVMKRLFTPKRLNENEKLVWQLVERYLDGFVPNGRCEFVHEFAQPFTVEVIADLLGVPDADRPGLREILTDTPASGAIDNPASNINLVLPVDDLFVRYIEDRRHEPRDDVMTLLATARFPDGSLPGVTELATQAGFLFAAGSDTTGRTLGFALKYLAEHPEVQQQVREQRELIPAFAEEMLRTEPPIKAHFRLARRTTTLSGVPIPAGTAVMVIIPALNRDPRVFEQPAEFHMDRPNAQSHAAFGRGVHTCIGQHLARRELRICLTRILDRMDDIRISEAEHGPTGARHFEYDKTFIMRGLHNLYLTFTPTAN
jgi:cytochrome P450